jgi:hypothetical protein
MAENRFVETDNNPFVTVSVPDEPKKEEPK